MPAGDIHIIDGVKYQLVDIRQGSVLGLLYPDNMICEFCVFFEEYEDCSLSDENGMLCGTYCFFIKLEETK